MNTMQTLDEIKLKLETQFPGAQITVENNSLLVPKEKWFEIAAALKADPECSFDYLSSVTAVDYKEYMEVVYHLYSMGKECGPLVIKVRTDRVEAKIPSVVSLWRSAEFQEREAYDLLGIHFEAHPDLRRIFMWENFEGYPLRKDYVAENQDREIENR